MKRLTILTLAIISFTLSAFADEATQTDWSGGDGIPGPVVNWGDDFDTSTDISWRALPDELHLSSTPKASVRYNVSDNSGADSVCSADIDDDGDTDIIGVSDNGDGIIWCENDDGSGTSWTEHTVYDGGSSIRTVRSADMDGDGDMDILSGDFWQNSVIWWENDDGSGISWTEHTVDYFEGVMSVYPADMDGDDDLDIVGGGHWDYRIVWWENDDGSGASWTEHVVEDYFGYTHSVYSADIDGDDDMDIIGGACSGFNTTWWENDDGNGTSWTEHTVDSNYSDALSVYSEDMDGDGDMDVLAARFMDPEATWWENDDGSGTSWTTHIIDGNCDPWSIYAADVDGDGDMDALTVGDPITWWENADGSATVWVEHTVDGSFGGSSSAVCSADIDGDGGLDVLGINYDNIAWWEVTEFKPSGDLTSSIFDAGGAVNDWGSINWTCDVTMVTTVTIEVRASNDPGNMGNWVTVTSPGDDLSNYIADGTRYFQYKISMGSSDSDVSPTFEDIVVSWDWVGIDGDKRENLRDWGNNLPKIFALHPAVPNPSSGTATIGFAIPRACEVELTLYDIKGRKIATLAEGAYQPGEYSAMVSGLASGVYVYQMTAGDFNDSKKMVVR